MEDEEFTYALELISSARQQFIEEVSSTKLTDEQKKYFGYILLDYPIREIKNLKEIRKQGVRRNINKVEKDLNKVINDFKNKENQMKSMGLKVIGFDKKDGNFIGLTEILQIIKDKATMAGLDKPTETKDAEFSLIPNRSIQ